MSPARGGRRGKKLVKARIRRRGRYALTCFQNRERRASVGTPSRNHLGSGSRRSNGQTTTSSLSCLQSFPGRLQVRLCRGQFRLGSRLSRHRFFQTAGHSALGFDRPPCRSLTLGFRQTYCGILPHSPDDPGLRLGN